MARGRSGRADQKAAAAPRPAGGSHPLAALGIDVSPRPATPGPPTFPGTFRGTAGHFTVEREHDDTTGLLSEPMVVFHFTAVDPSQGLIGRLVGPTPRCHYLSAAEQSRVTGLDSRIRAEVRRLSR